jgi:hypothetical protein
MNAGVSVVDEAEQMKWWDAHDVLSEDDKLSVEQCIAKALRMARECSHPDAQWLTSLFPEGCATVTRRRMHEVMLEQGDDPSSSRG